MAEPAAALAAKRSERDAFAAKLETSPLTGPAKVEALATLRALDASMANLAETLHSSEASLAETREQIDSTIKSLAHAKRQSARLRGSYLQALK